MSTPRYLWRQLTPEQRAELLAWRKANQRPWHGPPHRPNFGHLSFHLSAACYEHAPHICHSPERMDSNNPVHHGYVRLWTEWPWGNAREFLEAVGREEAERIWKEHPLRDYGAKWDPAEM